MVSHRKPKEKLSYEQLESKIRVLEEEVNRVRKWNKEANDAIEELTKPFCDFCPMVKVDFGYFNPFTGAVRPPDSDCPTGFEFGTEKCFALQMFKRGCKEVEEQQNKEAEEMAKEHEEEEGE